MVYWKMSRLILVSMILALPSGSFANQSSSMPPPVAQIKPANPPGSIKLQCGRTNKQLIRAQLEALARSDAILLDQYKRNRSAEADTEIYFHDLMSKEPALQEAQGALEELRNRAGVLSLANDMIRTAINARENKGLPVSKVFPRDSLSATAREQRMQADTILNEAFRSDDAGMRKKIKQIERELEALDADIEKIEARFQKIKNEYLRKQGVDPDWEVDWRRRSSKNGAERLRLEDLLNQKGKTCE